MHEPAYGLGRRSLFLVHPSKVVYNQFVMQVGPYVIRAPRRLHRKMETTTICKAAWLLVLNCDAPLLELKEALPSSEQQTATAVNAAT
jgi:hypothetical protein